jgi:hypothetical protein
MGKTDNNEKYSSEESKLPS